MKNIACILVLALAFLNSGLANPEALPELKGKTASAWRQSFEENRYLAGLNTIVPVSDESVRVINELLQEDNHISLQLLDLIFLANRNPETRSTNSLSKMVVLLPAIQRLTFSTNLCCRVEAICTLGSFGVLAKDSADSVARLLDDKSITVRLCAEETLAAFEDAAIPYLEKIKNAYLEEKSVSIRQRLLRVITRIEQPKGEPGNAPP